MDLSGLDSRIASNHMRAFSDDDDQQGRDNTLPQVSEMIGSRLEDACAVARFCRGEFAVIL